jgi:hypothetical protein
MIYLKKQREYAQQHHDKVIASLVSAAKAEGYREGVKAALEAICDAPNPVTFMGLKNAIEALLEKDNEALLTKGENE